MPESPPPVIALALEEYMASAAFCDPTSVTLKNRGLSNSPRNSSGIYLAQLNFGKTIPQPELEHQVRRVRRSDICLRRHDNTG